MKIRHIIVLAALAGGLASSSALAWDQDPFAMYLQRSDTVTLDAGNAKETNAVTHVIAWPPMSATAGFEQWRAFQEHRRYRRRWQQAAASAEAERSALIDSQQASAEVAPGQAMMHGIMESISKGAFSAG